MYSGKYKCGVTRELPTSLSSLNTTSSECNTYTVIYVLIILIASAVIVLTKEDQKKKEESQNMDDLFVLETCWSDTSAVLPREVSSLVAREST